MDNTGFPMYRRSTNGLNWYRIDSWTEMHEVQRVGRRLITHHMRANLYPERVRIMALVQLEHGHVVECAAEEVEGMIRQAAG